MQRSSVVRCSRLVLRPSGCLVLNLSPSLPVVVGVRFNEKQSLAAWESILWNLLLRPNQLTIVTVDT